jgi:sialate O-acetylesterase
MLLAPIFHDHAVLQRDLPLPIWGTATAGTAITVRCAGREAITKADRYGRWIVRLAPLPAGGPHELTVSGPTGELVVRDLLVGDVWICSGQSNMEWKASQCGVEPAGLPPAALAKLRLLTVTTPAQLGRGDAIDGSWTVATPESIKAFSAVGGWFGQELHRNLDIPIGLICNAWGGTRVQAWISREGLLADGAAGVEVRQLDSWLYDANRPGPKWTSMAEWERQGAPQDQGDAGSPKGWSQLAFNDASWSSMPMPSRWQDHGHPGSGVYWFRRQVTIPAAWRGRDLKVGLGAIDKHDDTFVNGERIGGISWERNDAWCTPRHYTIPARLIGADGKLVIAVRARSHVFHGGMIGPSEGMLLHPVDDTAGAIPLTGAWRYAIEQDWGMVAPPAMTEFGNGSPNTPGILFDARLHPLIPYGIAGAIWYQGESNASEATVYRRLLPAMITDWRRAWGLGDFPFLQVQLANYKAPLGPTVRSEWAELREAQNSALSLPNTGIAVAIDIGDAQDIHPKNKYDVGVRLARWALAEMYGRGGVASGPLFKSATFLANGRVRVNFNHLGGGLVAKGGALQRFAIAGPDRAFKLAEATIVGETVEVWHPEITRPAAVRYAWADNPEGCNLYNAAGLPASPFRSDDWPV